MYVILLYLSQRLEKSFDYYLISIHTERVTRVHDYYIHDDKNNNYNDNNNNDFEDA